MKESKEAFAYDAATEMRALNEQFSKTARVSSINALAQKFASDMLGGPLAEHFVERFHTGSYQDATKTDIDSKKLAIWAFAVAEKIVEEQERRVVAVVAEMRQGESP